MYWSWLWNPKDWGLEKVARFNNGNPYTSYRFGPLFVRRYWK